MELEEDSARPEGVIRFVVKNFSRLKDAVLSEPVYIQNLSWRLMCIQRSASLRGCKKFKTLAVFLQCCPETESSSWSCNATSQLVLVDQKHPEKSFKKKIQHLFFSEENDWGFSNFKEWNEILNTENGFLVDDTIIVEAHVVAEAPHGVAGLEAQERKERSEAHLYMSGPRRKDNSKTEMELEEDSARPEGVIRFVVKNFSRLKAAVLSEPVYIQNLPWRLMCIQRSAFLHGHEKFKTLSVFLQCCPETESSSWSCNATSQLVLVDQKHPEKSFKKKIQHLFFSEENDWGFSNFKEWNEILNTENGFLVDDTIIVEARVVAEAPHGVGGLEAQKRRDAHLYMNVEVITEDQFCGHQGFDLFDPQKQPSKIFKIRKEDKVAKMIKQLADALGYKPDQIRPWPFQSRRNDTYRVGIIDVKNVLNKKLLDVMDDENECCLFIETTDPSKPDAKLPSFDIETDILLFFKYYDPRSETMSYCGHAYVPMNAKISSLLPMLCERARLPKGTPLMVFEEVRPGLTEHFKDLNLTLEDYDNIMDGDICCFQRTDIDLDEFKLRTCTDYFRDYHNRVEVTVCDKNVPNDPGFNVILSSKTSYTQMAEKVAWYLDVDPSKIQFFKAQIDGGSPVGNPIPCTYEGTLRDLMVYNQKSPKKLFYQLVSP